ncbi:hypothetical protein [Paenarthrobacter sp. JL.01a]|uniref:hypothetical protein n=1 Tax=Paenarthrobacter sp. JL.01a TaxID=2979324 RepID=UPI0021C79A0F|nr:hypothetical protein [Paenarthrobacter sp. JL.01a]UXM92492.1 hypothetical protein N5P29_03980 [Paenarthrobacter sp. JL.01a]
MKSPSLPSLGPNVKYLGKRTGPDEEYCRLDGLPFKRLVGRYRVDDFLVEIGWVVDYKLGSFREPHQLTIQFDSEDFGIKVASDPHSQHASALNGITTSLLRSIPMAHARALMRDRHEQLSVAALKDEITPLPARVNSEADYVHVSCAYVALGSCSVEPIKRLAEWTGESADTWSARLRRARAKGILEGRGRNSRIAPSYLKRSNELWMRMRAGKDNPDGRH